MHGVCVLVDHIFFICSLSCKAKINKWEHITKKFLHSKQIINKMRKQPPEWEKICANHMPDKELISQIFPPLQDPICDHTLYLVVMSLVFFNLE